jgi:phosphatidylserine/phosphatidylglycerophosphate/cardiolipin synthase-like enzyme
MRGRRWRAAVLACALLSPSAEAGRGDLAQVEAAFSPGDDIAALISGRIARSRKSVQMQAYIFTDRRIAHALLAARKRGVDVEIIGDAAQFESGALPHLKALERAGARIYLNAAHAASHNKIVIIDGAEAAATVVTGSYNFTSSANLRNAENVVVISANRRLAARFVENFEFHRGQSQPWH